MQTLLPSTKCQEAGKPASTPGAFVIIHSYLEVILMPLNEVFFFLSGLSVGIVFGTLFMIVIRA